jgi:hypothetical protein
MATRKDPMKNISLAAATLSATAVVVLTGSSTLASAASAPCTAKPVTINGAAGLALCGPATATLTVKGKTYNFRNGFCAEPITNSDSFQLTLGVDVPAFGGPNNNGDKPGFSLDIAKSQTSAAVAFAWFGGHELVKQVQVTLKSKALPEGTFKGKTSAFSGTWNCHGVIYKS